MLRLSRRSILTAGGALVLGSRCGLDLKISDSASYDEVLDALVGTDFEFGSGLSNHAPMVADALVAANHPDRVVPFLQGYVKQLQRRTVAAPIELSKRPAALGNFELREEWAATFEEELEKMTPRALFQREWPVLAPGWLAAGWHGLLRTAHAVRALEREDTPSRRRELAQGLAFWAARHTRLPGTPGAQAESGLDVVSALQRVAPIPGSEQIRSGLIEPRFHPLSNHPEFAAAVEAVDLGAQPVAAALDALTAAASRLMVNANPKDIAFLHGVTGTAAFRLVMPWLEAEGQRLGLGYAFQAVAGLYAAQGDASAQFDAVADPTETVESLLAATGEYRDEHAIKLTEAAVREFAVSGKPELLTAAERYVA